MADSKTRDRPLSEPAPKAGDAGSPSSSSKAARVAANPLLELKTLRKQTEKQEIKIKGLMTEKEILTKELELTTARAKTVQEKYEQMAHLFAEKEAECSNLKDEIIQLKDEGGKARLQVVEQMHTLEKKKGALSLTENEIRVLERQVEETEKQCADLQEELRQYVQDPVPYVKVRIHVRGGMLAIKHPRRGTLDGLNDALVELLDTVDIGQSRDLPLMFEYMDHDRDWVVMHPNEGVDSAFGNRDAIDVRIFAGEITAVPTQFVENQSLIPAVSDFEHLSSIMPDIPSPSPPPAAGRETLRAVSPGVSESPRHSSPSPLPPPTGGISPLRSSPHVQHADSPPLRTAAPHSSVVKQTHASIQSETLTPLRASVGTGTSPVTSAPIDEAGTAASARTREAGVQSFGEDASTQTVIASSQTVIDIAEREATVVASASSLTRESNDTKGNTPHEEPPTSHFQQQRQVDSPPPSAVGVRSSSPQPTQRVGDDEGHIQRGRSRLLTVVKARLVRIGYDGRQQARIPNWVVEGCMDKVLSDETISASGGDHSDVDESVIEELTALIEAENRLRNIDMLIADRVAGGKSTTAIELPPARSRSPQRNAVSPERQRSTSPLKVNYSRRSVSPPPRRRQEVPDEFVEHRGRTIGAGGIRRAAGLKERPRETPSPRRVRYADQVAGQSRAEVTAVVAPIVEREERWYPIPDEQPDGSPQSRDASPLRRENRSPMRIDRPQVERELERAATPLSGRSSPADILPQPSRQPRMAEPTNRTLAMQQLMQNIEAEVIEREERMFPSHSRDRPRHVAAATPELHSMESSTELTPVRRMRKTTSMHVGSDPVRRRFPKSPKAHGETSTALGIIAFPEGDRLVSSEALQPYDSPPRQPNLLPNGRAAGTQPSVHGQAPSNKGMAAYVQQEVQAVLQRMEGMDGAQSLSQRERELMAIVTLEKELQEVEKEIMREKTGMTLI